MTTQVKEEQANPYNMKKSWHKGDDKRFVSSNELYFEDPAEKNKLFKSSDVNEAEQEDNVQVENLETVKDTPYKKPDYKKRYDDLKRHYDSKLNEFKAREQELLEEATKNRQNYKAPKSIEELEQFREEYPDVYEVVETVSHLKSQEQSKDLQEKINRLEQREEELLRKDAEKRLMEKHPDFEDIRNSDDFHNWAKEQPKSIQDWIYENADDADLASTALDLFKTHMGMDNSKKTKSNSKQTKKSAADMISTKTTTVEPKQEKIWSETEIAAMSMDEFYKFEDEISEAMQQGRIVK